MKVQILLPLSIVVAVASFGLMKIRLKEVVNEEKRAKFQDVKLRVTADVLNEYAKEKQNTESQLKEATTEQKELENAFNALQMTGLDTKKAEVDVCKGTKKTAEDEIASLEQQLKTFEANTPKEKTAWETEVTALKEKLTAPSPLCNYLKAGSSVQGLNCPEKKEAPKQEDQKPEAPKQEEQKPAAPKQEEQKPEAPKQEEQKPEAPKQEVPKPEAPKQEVPKPEAPKQEVPKPEAPKQEEQKPEAPKQEVPKPEAPKQEEQKPEAPKQ